MTVPAFVSARRSIRSFAETPIDTSLLDACIEAACLAPAPHHSRPWRWVVITDASAKRALAEGMAEQWRIDLLNDAVQPERINALAAASIQRLTAAPVLVLGCITDDGLDRYPDPRRQAAETGMALLSLGAAVENLMLTATELGLASCWVAAPIFCPEAARAALAIDSTWVPQALVSLGYPAADYTPRARSAVDLTHLRVRI